MSVLLLWAAALVGISMAEETIVLSQLVHRHGARGPLPPANESSWCPPEGCGLLNAEGEDMLVQLGDLLRVRYGSLYFNSTNYVDALNGNLIYSQSTDRPRTIQSADGVLRGLFPAIDEGFYPAIYNVPELTDTLLLAKAWPAYSLWQSEMKKSGQFGSWLADTVSAQFPNESVIVALASEAQFDEYCAKLSYNGICVSAIQDLAASLNALGQLSSYPLMSDYYVQLNAVKSMYHGLQWRYEPSAYPLDEARGTVQWLAQAVLGNALSFANSPGESPPTFFHYSAHDGTTMPFSLAIGDVELLPPFGQMYLIDLLKDGGAYYVRGIKGAPLQAPGPHTYTTEPLQLGGIDSSGRTYYINGTTDRMPIIDFARFVDSTKGTSPLGICYLEASVLQALGCNDVGGAADKECLPYRANCPLTCCPAGTFLRYADYACVTQNPDL